MTVIIIIIIFVITFIQGTTTTATTTTTTIMIIIVLVLHILQPVAESAAIKYSFVKWKDKRTINCHYSP